MKDHCLGWMGRIFGHKFVTVYDTNERPPTHMKVSGDMTSFIEAAKIKVSTVKSIHCTRCGKEVEIKQL